MSEFFVYPEDLSDNEETTFTSTSTSPSFSEENYSFNQELCKIIENEIKSKLKTNKLVEKPTQIETNDSKGDTQVSLSK